MSTYIVRPIAINFLIHAFLLVVGVLTLRYFFSGYSILNQDLLRQLTANSFSSIQYYVNDTVRSVEGWAAYLTLVSLLTSTVWILFANTREAAGETHARSMLGYWFLGGLVIGFACVAITWWEFSHKRLASNLSDHLVVPLMVTVGLTVLVAYYLGTAIGAKPVMRRSVPFASVWL